MVQIWLGILIITLGPWDHLVSTPIIMMKSESPEYLIIIKRAFFDSELVLVGENEFPETKEKSESKH